MILMVNLFWVFRCAHGFQNFSLVVPISSFDDTDKNDNCAIINGKGVVYG